MTIAYLNGETTELENAKVSVLDRGFLFGDSLYEVIPVYEGSPFGLEAHLDRLYHGLEQIHLKLGKTRLELTSIIAEVVAQNKHPYQAVYIQVTRGFQPKREHAIPKEYQPTLLVTSAPFELKSLKEMSKGISATTVQDTRWLRCHIKATTLLANILCLQEAKNKDTDEAILIRGDHAVESVSSNLFVVGKGIIKTPPLDNILGGITRGVVLDIARAQGIDIQETNISESELYTADEIWLTGSIREILPIVSLNGKPVGTGKAGPMWHFMENEYRQLLLPTKTIMRFPCEHTFKIMGKASDEFETAVLSIMNQHANLAENSIQTKLSKEKTYLSMSITITAESKQQLDQIYKELSGHPLVMYTL